MVLFKIICVEYFIKSLGGITNGVLMTYFSIHLGVKGEIHKMNKQTKRHLFFMKGLGDVYEKWVLKNMLEVIFERFSPRNRSLD